MSVCAWMMRIVFLIFVQGSEKGSSLTTGLHASDLLRTDLNIWYTFVRTPEYRKKRHHQFHIYKSIKDLLPKRSFYVICHNNKKKAKKVCYFEAHLLYCNCQPTFLWGWCIYTQKSDFNTSFTSLICIFVAASPCWPISCCWPNSLHQLEVAVVVCGSGAKVW